MCANSIVLFLIFAANTPTAMHEALPMYDMCINLSLSLYIYIYYIYICIYIYIYITIIHMIMIIRVCMCVYTYIYIYVYTYIRTFARARARGRGQACGVLVCLVLFQVTWFLSGHVHRACLTHERASAQTFQIACVANRTRQGSELCRRFFRVLGFHLGMCK